MAEVFVDATLAAPTRGETGAAVSSGPRVGPNTLAEILCTGKVRVIITGENGPIAGSDLGEAIPPAVRSYVLFRDQGSCSIEGCRSRYRLQPHHIKQRAAGGTHDPANLITVCWYHHHIAIHMLGMRIDPDSPTHRRRLIGSQPTTGPPPKPPDLMQPRLGPETQSKPSKSQTFLVLDGSPRVQPRLLQPLIRSIAIRITGP